MLIETIFPDNMEEHNKALLQDVMFDCMKYTSNLVDAIAMFNQLSETAFMAELIDNGRLNPPSIKISRVARKAMH